MGVFNEDQVEALNNLPRILRPLGGPFDYTLSDGGEGLGDLLNKLITADDAPSSTSGVNVGSGSYVFKDKLGDNLRFRSIVGGTNITSTQSANEITIDNDLDVDGINVGAGAEVFKDQLGDDLRFRSIVAGTDIGVSQTANEITINNTADDTTLQEAYDAGSDGDIQIDSGNGPVRILDASPATGGDIFSVNSTNGGDTLFRVRDDIHVRTDILTEVDETNTVGSASYRFLDMRARRAAFVSGTNATITFTDGYYSQGGIIAGRSSYSTLELGGNYPPNAILGSATGTAFNTVRIRNQGGGGTIIGSAFGRGSGAVAELTIDNTSYGSFVGGYAVTSGINSTARVTAQGSYGAFIWGYPFGSSGGTGIIGAYNGSHGSFVSGRIMGSGTNTIRSYNSPGSFVQGISTGTTGSTIEANGASGSFVQGYTSGRGRIRVTADGAFAQGRSVGTNVNTLIHASAFGAFVQGAVDNSRQLVSSGIGSSALGYAASANITASGRGSLAIGYTGSSTVISATANNAFQFAQGTNSTTNSLQVGSGVLLQTNGNVRIDGDIDHNGSNIGFFSVTPVAQQNITGARDDPEAALANLLTGLDNLGLITDNTTAS